MDARFETHFDDLQDLLTGADIDELDDLETLLMVLFARPVGVEEVWEEDDSASTALEVVISGKESAIGTTYAFPMSVVQLVRGCAETVHELGPYDGDDLGLAGAAPDVLTMSESALVERLQQSLGQVRLFNMMGDDG